MKKISILIADDSVLFRNYIQNSLKDEDFVDKITTAQNGKIALQKMEGCLPDLCIIDLDMPELNGIEMIKEIKARKYETKMLIFSSTNFQNVDSTLEALELGATDFVLKPSSGGITTDPVEKIKEALVPKIKGIFTINSSTEVKEKKVYPKNPTLWETFLPEVLVIASSTGGPLVLETFFSYLKDVYIPFPILISQHMPAMFTKNLVEKLGKLSNKEAKEGENGEIVKPNCIYIAPGDFHMLLAKDKDKNTVISINKNELRNFIRPCADFLFETAADIYGKKTMSIVFTGMGRDGADGANYIKQRNGAVLIQSKETCIVFGMPGAVYTEGNFDYIGSPKELADKIIKISNTKSLYGKSA